MAGRNFSIEDKLNAHDVLIASRLGVIELIQSGITTFNDMYFFPESTARAVNEGGIRGCIGISLFGDLSDTKKRIQERELVMKESMSVSGEESILISLLMPSTPVRKRLINMVMIGQKSINEECIPILVKP